MTIDKDDSPVRSGSSSFSLREIHIKVRNCLFDLTTLEGDLAVIEKPQCDVSHKIIKNSAMQNIDESHKMIHTEFYYALRRSTSLLNYVQ